MGTIPLAPIMEGIPRYTVMQWGPCQRLITLIHGLPTGTTRLLYPGMIHGKLCGILGIRPGIILGVPPGIRHGVILGVPLGIRPGAILGVILGIHLGIHPGVHLGIHPGITPGPPPIRVLLPVTWLAPLYIHLQVIKRNLNR